MFERRATRAGGSTWAGAVATGSPGGAAVAEAPGAGLDEPGSLGACAPHEHINAAPINKASKRCLVYMSAAPDAAQRRRTARCKRLGHHVRHSRRRIDPGISPFDVI